MLTHWKTPQPHFQSSFACPPPTETISPPFSQTRHPPKLISLSLSLLLKSRVPPIDSISLSGSYSNHGISKVVGSAATTFLLASLCMIDSGFSLVPIVPVLYDSVVAYIVTAASHPAANLPAILGKTPDGRFTLWSKILLAPFLIFARAYVLFKRLKRRGREPAFSEIADGVYVGGWPTSPKHLPPGNPAVVHCTCELPRSNVVSEDACLCIPTWDMRSPNPLQIEAAVQWACRFRAQKKPVFIHWRSWEECLCGVCASSCFRCG